MNINILSELYFFFFVIFLRQLPQRFYLVFQTSTTMFRQLFCWNKLLSGTMFRRACNAVEQNLLTATKPHGSIAAVLRSCRGTSYDGILCRGTSYNGILCRCCSAARTSLLHDGIRCRGTSYDGILCRCSGLRTTASNAVAADFVRRHRMPSDFVTLLQHC